MTSAAKLRTGMRMALDDFLALDETDGKWELDDGVLYITASGSPDHQFLIMEFSRHIDDYLDRFDQPPAQFYHEMTTVLSRELQHREERSDVAIPLRSSPERDPVAITRWPRNDTVTQLELRGGVYVERAVLGPGGVLTTPLLPELVIPLSEIFHHRRRPPREG